MVRDLVRILEFLRVVVVVSSSRVVSLLIYGGINKKYAMRCMYAIR